jgi:voltage-gated potassium channel
VEVGRDYSDSLIKNRHVGPKSDRITTAKMESLAGAPADPANSHGHLDTPVSARPVWRAWPSGRVAAFVNRYRWPWELTMAAFTVVYVGLAFFEDALIGSALSFVLLSFSALFLAEFTVRCYDAESRIVYLRQHWVDLITSIPIIGPFRFLRLLRLISFIRLGAAARSLSTGRRIAEAEPTVGFWVLGPTLLLLWAGAGYGYFILEQGSNPKVNNFSDALYMAFMTVTTLGYGSSIAPVTAGGRLLTGVLIFLGIGLVGFASSRLASYLLQHEDKDLKAMRAALARQERLLLEISSRLARAEEGSALDDELHP